MKKIYMVVFALLAIFSVTMSATALEQKTIDRQNGMAAYADWMDTTPEGLTTDTSLSVTQSNDGTDIYISICSYGNEGSNWSCKSGYKFTQDDVFSIDRRLNSANLEVVKIDLYQWNCDETGMCWETPDGTANIGANWAGNGKVSKSSYKYTSRSGDFISKYSDSSSMREATVTGSLDGLELGPSNYGGLLIFKDTSIWMQK
jgi:hypothetical protein